MSEYYTTPFDKFQNSTLLTASYSHSHQLSASLIACIVAAVLALINIAATAVIFVLLKRMRKLSYRYNPPLARTELLGSEVLGNPRQELPDNSRADLSRRQSHNGMGALRPDLSSGAQYGYVEQRATYSTNEVGRERVMPWATKYDALDGKWPVELSSTDAESRQFELDGRPLRSDSERTSIVQSSTPRRDSGLISHMHGSTLHDAKSVPTSTFDANRRLSHTHQSFSPLRAEMQSPELGPDLVSPSSHVGYTPSSMTRTFPLSPVSAISTPTNRVGPGDNVGMNYSSPSGYNGFLSDLDGRPIQQSPDSTPLLYDGPDVQSAPVGSALQSPSIGFAQSPQSGIQSYELSNPVRSIDPHHGNDISGNDPFIVGDKRHISASLSNTVHPSVVRPERLNQAHAKYTEGLSLNSSPSSAESWESLSDPSWSFNRPTNMTTPTSPAAYSGTPYLGFRGSGDYPIFVSKEMASGRKPFEVPISSQAFEINPSQPKNVFSTSESTSEILTCSKCGTRFTGQSACSNRKRHETEQHTKTKKRKRYSCSRCGKYYLRDAYRLNHEKSCLPRPRDNS